MTDIIFRSTGLRDTVSCHGHFFLELLVFRRFEEGICEYIMGREFRLEQGSILYVLARAFAKRFVNGRDGC